MSETHGPLYKELRDKKRLCYALQTGYDSTIPEASGFFFQTATSGDHCAEIEEAWLKCIETIAQQGISDEHLETLKNSARVSTILNSENLNVNDVITQMKYKISYADIVEEIKKLTLEDLKNAAKSLAEKNYVISIALPEKK